MGQRRIARITLPTLAPIIVAVALTLLIPGMLTLAPAAQAAPRSASLVAATHAGCQSKVAGKHVYDCAGVLTSDEIASLETHAAADIQAGAPVNDNGGSSSTTGAASGPVGNPAVAAFDGWPFNILALLLVVFGVLLLRHHPGKRQPIPDDILPEKGNTPPNDLPPALAGALVAGHVRDDQIEGTVFDFARRKMLALEPAEHNQMQIKLLTSGAHLTGYEAKVWESLASHADGSKIIPNSQLINVRGQWYMARAALQGELVGRGWFDENVAARRQPYYLFGGVCLGLAALGVLLAFIGLNGWALFGALALLVIGIITLSGGAAILDTTDAGEEAALPWRAFSQRLSLNQQLGKIETDELDMLLPYAIALGISYVLTPQLQTASDQGYAPGWFVPGRYYNRALGFYPYWLAWHGSIYPVSTSTGMYHGGFSGGGFSGGSFGGGGAAVGGGGAGGAF